VSLIYVIVARIPADGIAAFQCYESAVLPLLADHGAVLERRLRSADGCTEVHLTRFPSAVAFTGYRDDPRREAQQRLLRGSGAEIELHELHDV
jgi:hypothetical protein